MVANTSIDTIQQFRSNADRVRKFANIEGYYTTDQGGQVETLPAFIKRQGDALRTRYPGDNFKGNFSTAAAYVQNDVVRSANGLAYLCIAPAAASAVQPENNGALWRVWQGVTFPDFLTDSASNLITYRAPLPGSVAQKVGDVLGEVLTPQRFGAKGDGATVNTAAFTALSAYVNALPLTARPVPIYFPYGVYLYAGGLAFERPVVLYSDQGAVLNYTGNAAAIKLGKDGITNFDVFLQGEYTVDGLRITGGAAAIHGIYINEYVIEPRIRNVTFEDFGNASSYDIYTQFENWDILIENCRKLVYSSTTATGAFIAIVGRKKDNTRYDGGNSRATIRDCWMTSYSNQQLGYFAYVNAVKCRIIGGGHQHSNGGILLGPLASGTLIDGVYAELSTAVPHYVQAYSVDAGNGNYHFPQNVTIRNGYINMHKEVIGGNGKLIKAADANVKLKGWTVEDITIANFAVNQILIEQNNVAGQTLNRYSNLKKLFVPAASDDGSSFLLRGGYSIAEEWYAGDSYDGLSLGTPARKDFTANTARLNMLATGAPNDSVISIAGFGDGFGYGIKSKLAATAAANAGWHFRTYDGTGTAVGGIYSSGSATNFLTSSDYRLKSAVVDLAGSGAFIDSLRPREWQWKTDGRRGVGFLAHELQATSPSSVAGVKDGVDSQGKPVYQSVEYGSAEVMGHIVAELQQLRKRVAVLEGKA